MAFENSTSQVTKLLILNVIAQQSLILGLNYKYNDIIERVLSDYVDYVFAPVIY